MTSTKITDLRPTEERSATVTRRRRSSKLAPVTFQGVTYPSKAALAAAFGITDGLLNQRLSRGWTLERSLHEQVDEAWVEARRKDAAKHVTYHGQTYTSLTLLCKALRISLRLLKRRLAGGMDLEEAVASTLAGQEAQRLGRIRPVEYRGQVFRNFVALCKELNLPVNVLRGRVDTLGWTIEKAIETPIIQRTSRKQSASRRNWSFHPAEVRA